MLIHPTSGIRMVCIYIYIIYVWSGLTTAAGIVASAGHTEKPKGGSSEAGTHGKTKKRLQLNARQLLVFPVSWRAQGSGLRFAQHQHQDCIPAAQRRRKAPGEHSRSRSSGGRSPNTESSNRTNSWSWTDTCWVRPPPLNLVFGFRMRKYAIPPSSLNMSRGRIRSFRNAASGSPGLAIPRKPNVKMPAKHRHFQPSATPIIALKIEKGNGPDGQWTPSFPTLTPSTSI